LGLRAPAERRRDPSHDPNTRRGEEDE
jgi:hypothetical protein